MTQLLGNIVADFETQLATKIAVSDTTATLQSATDDDGVALPTGHYLLTVDGNNSAKEHFSCTLTGTSLTALKTVSRQGTETSGALRVHRIGAKVVLTDFANMLHLTKQVSGLEGLDGSNPLIYTASPTLSDDKHVATKKYVDDTAIAGSPKATEAVYGISKLSVAAADAAIPIVVGDNDGRLPTQNENNALVGTSGTATSTSNKLVDAADVTEAKTASKIPRRDSNSDVLVATTPTAGDAATSKTYVDALVVSNALNLTLISSSSASGTVAVPSGTKMVVINVTDTGVGSYSTGQVQLTLYSTGLTSATVTVVGSNISSLARGDISAAWNTGGATITCGGTSRTFYFYK